MTLGQLAAMMNVPFSPPSEDLTVVVEPTKDGIGLRRRRRLTIDAQSRRRFQSKKAGTAEMSCQGRR
jgi:hypothetical protein